MRIDPSTKSNVDRIDGRKMNRLRRVQSLPGRGGLGDWVVLDVNGKDVTYAWLEGEWVPVGAVSGDGTFPTELGAPFESELDAPFDSALGAPFGTTLGE